MRFPACGLVEEFCTCCAGYWACFPFEQFEASTTTLGGWSIGEGFVLIGYGIECEDGVVDTLDMFRGDVPTLLEHWEQDIFNKPHGGYGRVRHHEAGLDLHKSGRVAEMDRQGSEGAGGNCCGLEGDFEEPVFNQAIDVNGVGSGRR